VLNKPLETFDAQRELTQRHASLRGQAALPEAIQQLGT